MWTRFCKNNHICCLQSNTKVFSLIAFNIETFLVLTNFSHKPKLLQITFYYQENLTVITGSLYHITIDKWSSLLWYLSTLQRVLNYLYLSHFLKYKAVTFISFLKWCHWLAFVTIIYFLTIDVGIYFQGNLLKVVVCHKLSHYSLSGHFHWVLRPLWIYRR